MVVGGGAAPTASTPTATPKTSGGSGTDLCSLMTAAKTSDINKVTYSGTSPKHVAKVEVSVVSVDGCYQQVKDADGPGTTVSGVGDATFGYQIGIMVRDGSTCVEVEGSTHTELRDDYSHDVALAKIILAALH